MGLKKNNNLILVDCKTILPNTSIVFWYQILGIFLNGSKNGKGKYIYRNKEYYKGKTFIKLLTIIYQRIGHQFARS